ncbi:unnamed protein product [Effrenium voratum]|nr:unnamed protein product [Effrenium voratum]
MAPLDVGPSTIFDARPSLVDPVVQELGRILEEHGPVPNAQIELELRLGVLRGSGAGASAARVDLPLGSEALLARCEAFPFRFQAGLPPETYAGLMHRLEVLRAEGLECSVRSEQLLDTLYDPPETGRTGGPMNRSQLRMTHRRDKDRWVPCRPVLKTRHEALDLFTGRLRPEKGGIFDLRAALSTEAPANKPKTEVRLKREKQRKVFDFRAWRVDFTAVRSSDQTSKELSYEVELELNSQILQKNLEAKMAGKPHQLWELLTDFLNAGRDLAAAWI